jgi:hypothetical protein
VLFVDHRTTEAQFRFQHPGNPKTHVNSAPNTSPGFSSQSSASCPTFPCSAFVLSCSAAGTFFLSHCPEYAPATREVETRVGLPAKSAPPGHSSPAYSLTSILLLFSHLLLVSATVHSNSRFSPAPCCVPCPGEEPGVRPALEHG